MIPSSASPPIATASREVELKVVPSHRMQVKLLSALKGDSLSHAVSILTHALSLGNYAVKPIGTQSIVDDYFDTLDLDLFRTGRSLRIRRCAGTHTLTLKVARSVERGKFDRDEIESRLSTQELAEGYLNGFAKVSNYVVDLDVKAIEPMLQVHNEREVFLVTHDSEAYELAVDVFRYFNPRTALDSSSQFEIELEAKSPAAEGKLPRMREHVLGVLSTDRPFEASVESKYARGIRILGLDESIDRRRLGDWVTSRNGAVRNFQLTVWAFVLSVIGLILSVVSLLK